MSPGQGSPTQPKRSNGFVRRFTRGRKHCTARPRQPRRCRADSTTTPRPCGCSWELPRRQSPVLIARVADGPLTVYDLEAMARPPGWIVLSVCDTGCSEVHPGDELMGTSAALLSLGTRASSRAWRLFRMTGRSASCSPSTASLHEVTAWRGRSRPPRHVPFPSRSRSEISPWAIDQLTRRWRPGPLCASALGKLSKERGLTTSPTATTGQARGFDDPVRRVSRARR